MTLFALILLGLVSDPPESPAPLNPQLLEVARSMRGESIGNGSCGAFVSEALRQAGGSRRRGSGGRGWGEELQPNDELLPGDILHFKDVLMIHERRSPTGSAAKKSYQFPSHVAIVSEVRRPRTGMRVSILHQNVQAHGSRSLSPDVVTEWTLNMADYRSGTIKAYRLVRAEAPATSP